MIFNCPDDIQAHLHCQPVTAKILWQRGLRDLDVLESFLKPELSHLPDPLSLIDMKKAVERTAEAIANDEVIAIYGDYDVDGTCGSALLFDVFRKLGLEKNLIVYQPDRFNEGYGVHAKALEELSEKGARLVITVDCGITALAQVERANELGLDVIILDHHKLAEQMPAAVAVVNPQRPDDESGLENLCGCGIAFFFAVALRAELREQGFFESKEQEPNLKALLDLVAVATIADMMDVRGVNRILITHGLQVMATRPRIGIKAMLEANAITKPTAMHCGFVLGPRINAAGRLKHAKAAFELLTTEDYSSAKKLMAEIEQLNTDRRNVQDEVFVEARAQALAQINDPMWNKIAQERGIDATGLWPRAIVLTSEHWHEGVVGIVASKIVEEFKRPAFILAKKEGTAEETLKGSVRSLGKVDIISAISHESVAKHLLNFGGHAFAGGVTLLKEKLNDFRVALNEHLFASTEKSDYKKDIFFDADAALNEINPRLAEELIALGPFGNQFPEPILRLVKAPKPEIKIMKEKHLKVRFSSPNQSPTDCVWFNVPQLELSKEHLLKSEESALWVSPQWNEWQGTRKLQLRILHADFLNH